MIRGVLTFIDVDKQYAVALSDDGKTTAIIHKVTFDKCGQPFRASSIPQFIEFDVHSKLGTNDKTGVTNWISSEVKLLNA